MDADLLALLEEADNILKEGRRQSGTGEVVVPQYILSPTSVTCKGCQRVYHGKGLHATITELKPSTIRHCPKCITVDSFWELDPTFSPESFEEPTQETKQIIHDKKLTAVKGLIEVCNNIEIFLLQVGDPKGEELHKAIALVEEELDEYGWKLEPELTVHNMNTIEETN